MAVSTMVLGPINGWMRRATSAMPGALTETMTRSCTPSAAVLSLAVTACARSASPSRRRRPCARTAASVSPRATTLTSQPLAASLTPIQPPMAPAP